MHHCAKALCSAIAFAKGVARLAVPPPQPSRFVPMHRIVALALAALFVASAASSAQAPTPAPSSRLAALHEQDARLARIADTLLAANHPLCRQLMPVTGMVIHSQDQYGEAAMPAFTGATVAVAAVVPGSPADLAGLLAGDGLRAIGGRRLADLPPPPGGPLRDAVFQVLAELPATRPVVVQVVRAGQEFAVTLQPQPGCRALVEVVVGSGRIARSDGRVIQLGDGLTSELSDDGLAVTFAHELAHVVLEHRRRLSAAGVSKGLFGEFGADRRRNREAEVEADRLSVHLLANAGLDPQIAPRFWRSREARRVDAGVFRSAYYPPPSERAEIIARELAEHLPHGRGPSRPDHLLALRDTEF